MKLSGKFLVGAVIAVTTLIVGETVYKTYKELREVEDEEIKRAEEEVSNEDAEESTVPEREQTSTMIFKAFGKTAADITDFLSDNPEIIAVAGVGVALTVVGYKAGKNDGILSGFAYGYSNGMEHEASLINESCDRETLSNLQHKIDDYVHSNPDSINIRFSDSSYVKRNTEKIKRMKGLNL